tara:strand:- start:1027 stop:1335 length:309 start_codon:yes stop_codon:yes gene_type:complete
VKSKIKYFFYTGDSYVLFTLFGNSVHIPYIYDMDNNKKGTVVYTLKICFNPDTDEVEYIAEGMDNDFDFTEVNPFNLDVDLTPCLTSEDMETIKDLYDFEED